MRLLVKPLTALRPGITLDHDNNDQQKGVRDLHHAKLFDGRVGLGPYNHSLLLRLQRMSQ